MSDPAPRKPGRRAREEGRATGARDERGVSYTNLQTGRQEKQSDSWSDTSAGGQCFGEREGRDPRPGRPRPLPARLQSGRGRTWSASFRDSLDSCDGASPGSETESLTGAAVRESVGVSARGQGNADEGPGLCPG